MAKTIKKMMELLSEKYLNCDINCGEEDMIFISSKGDKYQEDEDIAEKMPIIQYVKGQSPDWALESEWGCACCNGCGPAGAERLIAELELLCKSFYSILLNSEVIEAKLLQLTELYYAHALKTMEQ